MNKAKLNKRYKTLRWLQHITFVASIIACALPVVLSCIKAAPSVEKNGGKWALGGVVVFFGGVAVFFGAIILLIVFRSLVSKFVSKLPYTLTVMVSVGAVMGLVCFLKQIINDAIAILAVGLVGAAVGFVLELIAMYCKAKADEVKELYVRGKYDEAI